MAKITVQNTNITIMNECGWGGLHFYYRFGKT